MTCNQHMNNIAERVGAGSTDPRRRIVKTGQALAENTHFQECSHDVVGLYAHKGTMCNTDDRVLWKVIKSQYGRGALNLPGAAGGHPPAMFPVASSLPIDEPQLDSWQVIAVWVDETPAGNSSEHESPCDSQNWPRPMDMNNSLNILVHNVIQRGPVGPQGKEPLALLVLDHVDPVGRYAVDQKKLLGRSGPKVKEPLALLVLIHADPAGKRGAIHRATSLWEPEIIPAINRNLDSRPMEGTTYLERPAPAVYLDSWPMEGNVRNRKLEWKPMQISAIIRNLDSRPMEGKTYLERPAPAVYLDSWRMDGKVRNKKLEWKPVIILADSYTLDSRPMEVMPYLEHPAPTVYLDSWLKKGASYPQAHVDWEVLSSKSSVNNVAIVKMVATDASDDVNTHLPENVTSMSTPMMAPAVLIRRYSDGQARYRQPNEGQS